MVDYEGTIPIRQGIFLKRRAIGWNRGPFDAQGNDLFKFAILVRLLAHLLRQYWLMTVAMISISLIKHQRQRFLWGDFNKPCLLIEKERSYRLKMFGIANSMVRRTLFL